MLQSNGDIDEDVCHWIKAGWMKLRQASRTLCDNSKKRQEDPTRAIMEVL
jgi:hypothetical protein